MQAVNQISLFVPLLVGMATTFGSIIVHGFILRFIISAVRRDLRLNRAGVKFWKDLVIVTGATMLALAGHLIEMALWAVTLELCGEFSGFAAAFYHSAGSYTTIGDGAVVISPRWKLLGPLEASDGMLMFGITTATLFAVVQRLLETRFARSGA